ncbi:MAG: magnesium transporter [Gammaproteobacteria bacterium]|nr:magnesium transporter [Gammaproteobacteria bacterium]
MSTSAVSAIVALNRRFLLGHPTEAAKHLEAMPTRAAAEVLTAQPATVTVSIWPHLVADVADALFAQLPDATARHLLTGLEPTAATALLNRQDVDKRAHYLAILDTRVATELRSMLQYPIDTAGRLMNPHILPFRGDMTAREALNRLRALKSHARGELLLIDDDGLLSGRVEIHDVALADPRQKLQSIAKPVLAAVTDTAPREEVVEKLEQYKLAGLPVVDFAGRLIGMIHQSALVTALQEEASLDIQTMVGVSKDERALSGVTFSVGKRLPWLHINLLTAFIAASVVGLFEDTIAKFTALAVLMPVVAGQAGNTGAQALAVTMRGLALREIGVRHWPKVVFKEINVALLNGLAIAVTTSAAVYLWSRSYGLALVMGIAMVLSLSTAGLTGALIPIILTRLGQDPAQASSILLTTVTDVVGFSSFLGIATLLSMLL